MVAEWILINLRTIEPVLIICWERYIAQAAPGAKVAESESEWKRDYDRDNATMLTCRLHTWSKQRGKHCRWFEPLRFQCPFHICHTYPCASERISWRWVRYIMILLLRMEMILTMAMLLSPCNPFRRRSCPPRSSKSQLSLPRTQSSAAGSPSLTRCHQKILCSSVIIIIIHFIAQITKLQCFTRRSVGLQDMEESPLRNINHS